MSVKETKNYTFSAIYEQFSCQYESFLLILHSIMHQELSFLTHQPSLISPHKDSHGGYKMRMFNTLKTNLYDFQEHF